MRGIKDIRESYTTYEGPGTAEDYEQAIIFACESLANEIESTNSSKIVLNRIGVLTLKTNKLMHYIHRYMRSGKWQRAKEGLKKLKNADRQIFGGFLSRIENEETERGNFIRRIRVLYEGDKDHDLSN